jgi:hypothetical protein
MGDLVNLRMQIARFMVQGYQIETRKIESQGFQMLSVAVTKECTKFDLIQYSDMAISETFLSLEPRMQGAERLQSPRY